MVNEQRLIDANVLYEAACVSYNNRANLCDECYSEIINLIDDQPTVDAVEVVHGRWERARYTEAPLYICSECDKPEYKEHRYCPNCGAKMDGGNEDA